MTTSQPRAQPVDLHLPQISNRQKIKHSDVSLAESGFWSREVSNADLPSREEEHLNHLFKIIEEPTISSAENTACIEINIVTDHSPTVQDFRRGSEESNRSCHSDASTPASTKPLIPEVQELDELAPTARQTDRLQVPRPSDLQKSEHHTPKSYNDEIILRDTVRCEMPAFVTNTDFNTLAAYLFSKKLLYSCEYTMLKSMPPGNERGNHFYIEILPHKGRHAYRRLYKCLRDEPEHLGHKDLVKILNKALKARQPPQSSSESSPTDSYAVHLQASENAHPQTKSCCVVQ